MHRTRLSLYYLATYLTLTGLAFLLAPQRALGLLLATGSYDDAFVRFTGAFMLAVATLVIQMIRFRLEVLYPTTLAVRVFFLVVIVWLYQETGDRLFLMVLGVVALGFLLTLFGLLADWRAASR